MRALAVLVASLLAFASAWAQPGAAPSGPSVSFNGSMGSKAALLLINGEMRSVPVGQRMNGVLLVSMEEGRVVVEAEGKRQTLMMGATPVWVGGGAAVNGGGRKIVLSAGPGGHFMANGSINGKSTQFMVDTGATTIALSRGMAMRMGLSLREGRSFMSQTANGPVRVTHVVLESVRIGDVEVREVDAAILPMDMSHVLLGNSFLSRFQMRQENDTLTLVLRF